MKENTVLGVTFTDVANRLMTAWKIADFREGAMWIFEHRYADRETLKNHGFNLLNVNPILVDKGDRIDTLVNSLTTWSKTPQGSDFWNNIFEKSARYCKY
jgi:hypothetical protein